MRGSSISGIPVVERGPDGKPARLVGILTNRDVRFADDPRQPISELMTRKVITVAEGVTKDEARRLLHQHRIEKLVVVDEAGRCVGLITVKDIEKATAHPDAAKDGDGMGGSHVLDCDEADAAARLITVKDIEKATAHPVAILGGVGMGGRLLDVLDCDEATQRPASSTTTSFSIRCWCSRRRASCLLTPSATVTALRVISSVIGWRG